MSLFEHHRQQLTESDAPLAARMRPRTLDEFIGQEHIVGQGRLLRRAIQADQLSSLIFYGPPGTGKTTLARVIANTTRAHFISINAVLAGVKELREAIATAQEQRGLYGLRTILFVDEVHRFNKAQQDALLPWVENGTVILIGATTENPYFEVNKALVSRSRLFQLKPLAETDLQRVIEQALTDGDRGYGTRSIHLGVAARDHLINVANGDARALLNALELAVETTSSQNGVVQISLAVAEESIQQRAVLYDKEGDAHFDTISAFIKSVRGSDPDAALFWLARMVYAGEDPRFIFRRMVILASEDVGLADPHAIVVVHACAEAFDRVGLPEGRYPLAHAALYLATCPKSNSVMGFFDALAAVEQEREEDVPLHLRDANRDKHSFGHGKGYLYPHSYREHWIAQQYLPKGLQGQVFYQPSERGYEHTIRQQVMRQREAQLAALVEGMGVELPETLTFSPTDSTTDRWLQRTLGQVGDRLASVRDRLFALNPPQRHHLILDMNAGSGLLTWEALRQVPEGGVYACVRQAKDAEALEEQAATLSELIRPVILQATLAELPNQLAAIAPEIRFDRIVGRNVVSQDLAQAAVVKQLVNWLQPDGALLLVEAIPAQTQRLYELLNKEGWDVQLYEKLAAAEEKIYKILPSSSFKPALWDTEALLDSLNEPSLTTTITVEQTVTHLRITPALIDRWFSPGQDRPSYADHLSASLSSAELATLRAIVVQRLSHQVVEWQGAIAFVSISKK